MKVEPDPRMIDSEMRRRLPDLEHDVRSEGLRIAVVPPGRIELCLDLDPALIHVNLGAALQAWSMDAETWQETELTANSIAFLPSRTRGSVRADSSLPGLVIEIDASRLPTILRDVIGGADLTLPRLYYEHDPIAGEMARAGINLMLAGVRPGFAADAFGIESLALGIVSRILRRVQEGRSRPDGDANEVAVARQRMAVVTDHVERNFDRTITVAEMARLVGMSATSFNATFRLAVGTSPARYVTLRRVAHARTLLAMADDPIIQVAFDCGFFDQSHLTRSFRAIIGTTPREYRRLWRAGMIG